MLVNLEGYNHVIYSKNGKDGEFYNVYVSSDREITFGTEYYTVLCSCSYFENKILPAFHGLIEVHIGFDKSKNNKPFLYIKG